MENNRRCVRMLTSSRELVTSSCNVTNSLTQEPVWSLERSLQHSSSKSLTIFAYSLRGTSDLVQESSFVSWLNSVTSAYLTVWICLLCSPTIFSLAPSLLFCLCLPFPAGIIVLQEVSFLIPAGEVVIQVWVTITLFSHNIKKTLCLSVFY